MLNCMLSAQSTREEFSIVLKWSLQHIHALR